MKFSQALTGAPHQLGDAVGQQLPPEQTSPPGHIVPQPPQLAASVSEVTHIPELQHRSPVAEQPDPLAPLGAALLPHPPAPLHTLVWQVPVGPVQLPCAVPLAMGVVVQLPPEQNWALAQSVAAAPQLLPGCPFAEFSVVQPPLPLQT